MSKKFRIVKESLNENDGHHFFIDDKGRLVIADHSIDDSEPLSPTNANDGVLYVDFNRPLQDATSGYYMPVRDGKRTSRSVFVTIEDALFAQNKMEKVFSITYS